MPLIVASSLRRTGGLVFLALTVLSGCAGPAALRGQAPLRDPAAPLASIADVDWRRLSGNWVVTQSAGAAPPAGTALSVALNAAGQGSWHLAGRPEALQPAGPGRLRGDGRDYWLLWADADARTAVIGAPGGEAVWIMDRATPSADRLAAARDILDWYGYDLARLR